MSDITDNRRSTRPRMNHDDGAATTTGVSEFDCPMTVVPLDGGPTG